MEKCLNHEYKNNDGRNFQFTKFSFIDFVLTDRRSPSGEQPKSAIGKSSSCRFSFSLSVSGVFSRNYSIINSYYTYRIRRPLREHRNYILPSAFFEDFDKIFISIRCVRDIPHYSCLCQILEGLLNLWPPEASARLRCRSNPIYADHKAKERLQRRKRACSKCLYYSNRFRDATLLPPEYIWFE